MDEICGEEPPARECDMLERLEDAADMLEDVGGGGTGDPAAAAAALNMDAEEAEEEPREE